VKENHSHTHDHHHHNHFHSHASAAGNILIAFYINLIFAFIELGGGFWTHSMAIQADALHDFGDSLSLLVIWYLQKLSNKPPSKEFSFGFSRLGILGALGTGIILISGSIYIMVQSLPKILNPTPVMSEGMILLGVLGVVVNGWAFIRTKNAVNISERMISLHMLEDLWGWVVVLIGAIVIQWKSWYWLDPLLSIFVSFFILQNTFKNLKEVFRILLQGASKSFSVDNVTALLAKHSVIKSFHHIHIWALNESYHVVTAHLVVSDNLTITEIQKIKWQVNEDLNHNIGACEAVFEFEVESSLCGEDQHKV
jgi:cobalt-zinc-cadmium efflux system protein